jgi:hypothetical protein
MAGRTIAHGYSAALAAILDAIRPGPVDTLVPLGDYINRGPDSPRVLDLLLCLAECCRLVPLLGNHEEMLLSALWLGCIGSAEEATSPSCGAAAPSTRRAHLGCRRTKTQECSVQPIRRGCFCGYFRSRLVAFPLHGDERLRFPTAAAMIVLQGTNPKGPDHERPRQSVRDWPGDPT